MFYTARVINCEDGKAVWPKQTVPAEVVMLPSSPVRPSFPIRPFSSQLIRWKTIEVVCNGVRGETAGVGGRRAIEWQKNTAQ